MLSTLLEVNDKRANPCIANRRSGFLLGGSGEVNGQQIAHNWWNRFPFASNYFF